MATGNDFAASRSRGGSRPAARRRRRPPPRLAALGPGVSGHTNGSQGRFGWAVDSFVGHGAVTLVLLCPAVTRSAFDGHGKTCSTAVRNVEDEVGEGS